MNITRMRRICGLLVLILLPACRAIPPSSPNTAIPVNSATNEVPHQVPITETVAATPLLTIPVQSTSTPTQEPSPHRAVVISWDGAPADRVEALMAGGDLPVLAALRSSGQQAEYAISVNPSLTAPGQIAIASGASPARSGMVSNRFHNANDNFYWYREGFNEPLDQAEPLWVTASRENISTAALFYPGGAPAQPWQSADFTVAYGEELAYSQQLFINLQPAAGWTGIAESFSPPLCGEFQIPEVGRVFILAVDQTNDGEAGYDTVYLNTLTEVTADTLSLQVGEWGELIFQANRQVGADVLLQEINSREAKLYHSGVYQNSAAPRDLLEALNQRFGYYRPPADSYALEHGWITPEDYILMLERAAQWNAQVTAWLLATYQPQLTYIWQDSFDQGGHAFLLVDQQQPGYTPERAELYANYYRRAAQAADQALAMTLETLNLENTAVFVVSDHGMAPLHTTVFVNTILEEAGLLVLDEKDYLVVEKSQAFAVATGGAAHVYINLVGREKNGIVSEEAYPQIIEMLRTLFQQARDPERDAFLFQRVLQREEYRLLGLDHPNSGDIFLQANPGYDLNGWRGFDTALVPARFYGQHGYDSELPEMRSIFVAAGGSIPPLEELIAPVSVLDYAPTLAKWLGIQPAASVEGEVILGLFE